MKPEAGTGDEPPKAAISIVDPAWRWEINPHGTVLCVKHPEYGWLTFLIPPATRAAMATALLHHALSQPSASPVPSDAEQAQGMSKQ